jgi:CRISPR-associated protein Cas2
LTGKLYIFKLVYMFVAGVFEASSDDHKQALSELFIEFGFKKIAFNVFECSSLSENNLNRLKYEIDKATDSYDIVRLYQYPMEDTLAISNLKNKKWKRLLLKI